MYITEDTSDGFYLPAPWNDRTKQRRQGRWFSKSLFSKPCYSCGRLNHQMMYLSRSENGERQLVHSCPISRDYGDIVRDIASKKDYDWTIMLSMSVIALVKYYGMKEDLIRKALEIYARNALELHPASSPLPENRDRTLAWLLHRSIKTGKMLSEIPDGTMSNRKNDEDVEVGRLFHGKFGSRDRTIPPCRNCGALDHGESSVACPWKKRGKDGNPKPEIFAEYWAKDPILVEKALDRYEFWGQGSKTTEEKMFNFRHEVMTLCGTLPDRSFTSISTQDLERDLLEGVASIDESRPCTLCFSGEHQTKATDRGGIMVCPFSFEDQPELRWPDPHKISQSCGPDGNKARRIIMDFYQVGSRSYHPVDGLLEETERLCEENRNHSFKRGNIASDICLFEDGEDESSQDS